MQMLEFFKGRIKTIKTYDMALVQFNIPLSSSIETKSPLRTMPKKRKKKSLNKHVNGRTDRTECFYTLGQGIFPKLFTTMILVDMVWNVSALYV